MPADQGLIDSVSNANTKTIVEAGAWSMAQQFAAHAQTAQDAAAHRARLQIMAEAELANSIALSRTVIAEVVKAVSDASSLAEKLSELTAALNSNQQGAKVAQTTPPETGVPK